MSGSGNSNAAATAAATVIKAYTDAKCRHTKDAAGVWSTQDCYEVKNANLEYFQWKIAPIFILGCALFAVFWGLVNALMVSVFLFIYQCMFNLGEKNFNRSNRKKQKKNPGMYRQVYNYEKRHHRH